jgi:serine phosphatase RsbU (regulator of sigma subunit)
MFWIIFCAWAVVIALNFILLRSVTRLPILSAVVTFATFIYSIYLLVRALREKRPGAWILMGGVLLFAFALGTILLRVANVFSFSFEYYVFFEIFIVLSIPVAVSIFLARNFARTSRDLTARVAEIEQLSARQIEHERQAAELRAENERRAKELEEARRLQISMLPKKLPELPNLEIAVYMKPATEVGGDYYDFHVASDGTLTVAIGDATGHGLKAGTVVTAAKALFANHAHESDVSQFLRRSSAALKKINLRGLFMAMTVLKLKNNRAVISTAGMPAALIYRGASREVEEISIKALPLGSVSSFPYQERQIDLASDDCILLMSDGFPEMFNQEGEMLGFDKAAEILPEIADRPAQEIVERLVETGERWAGGRPQDDDVTFVVLKIKDA